MNPQLSALLNNKPALFGVAAAGAVGLGLWTKKKKGAAATSAGPTSTIPGTIPAAAVVSGSSTGGYDSSAFDAYNALQPELEQILQQQNLATSGSSGITAPTPIASTLFSPTYNGQYVRFNNGQVDELESDGSLMWLNPSESAKALQMAGTGSLPINQLTVAAPTSGVFSSGDNVLAKQSKFSASS